MTNKYKAGDVVHVRLSHTDAAYLNVNREQYSASYYRDIIAHHSAPEPVVRIFSYYEDDKYICTLRLEWPDGDMNKPPVVTVEGV